MRKFILTAFLGLAACSGGEGLTGYVTPLSDQDASLLAYDVTLLTLQQAPGRGALAIQRPPNDTAMFTHLVADLNASGFQAAEGDKAKHYLQYAVSTLPEGTILRVRIDGISGARLYTAAKSGHLVADGPFTMQEAAE